jgi:FkbM family methyltransferase
MRKKVILDLGAHKGEDSDFYIKKGFRVIAVDANKKLCEIISLRFKDAINNNQFNILNYAVTERDNELITFYEDTTNSVWGTIFDSWASRNKKLGSSSVTTTINTIRLDTLIAKELQVDETIEYIKIDIEGADLIALRSLSDLKEKPRFISIESEKISWDKLIEEFTVFKQLGYTKFQLVDQSTIAEQQCPFPAQEGYHIDYKFEYGSSGLFGDELPGKWVTEEEALKAYKKIFVRYKYFGDYGIFNNKLIMKNRVLNKLMQIFKLRYPHVGWYDTHAAL